MPNPLAAYLSDQGMKAGEFCRLRKPPFPPSIVSEWIRGLRSPSYFSMLEIEKVTGGAISVAAWPLKRRKRSRRRLGATG